ncbi:Stage III sporulation protein AB (spore_III_AB) [Sporobacter termitidis DSM 10068]|uniref:Stage III sporulation protein AB (Spore_III_AB) n=1 Tax=Sporobacter termitidis DSM 10068 TaxID=1123282 RepID=A0A1M5Y8D4_9FIRM|nr:stage III sporulation protein AB [Sporobacter termitidis]SHI08327.1 Stage III sporulation protein AB (spore_III_AB) [Sporobacter termitidis DSM 10068]
MIRLIGAVLITAGTAAFGIMGVFRLRNRVRSLSAVISALAAMKSEICDRLTPMPELLRQMSGEATYPASLLFKNASERISGLGSKPFSAIWRQAVLNTPELLLTPGEELVLTELGMVLGRYDIGEQRSAIAYAERRMDEFLRRAEADREKNSKVHAFLGVAAGIFVVVILL